MGINIRVETRCFKFTLVQCYAPTTTTRNLKEAVKDRVYDTLSSLLADIPKHDLLALRVDMNVTVGHNNKGVKSREIIVWEPLIKQERYS